jgi:hypothetical protein
VGEVDEACRMVDLMTVHAVYYALCNVLVL